MNICDKFDLNFISLYNLLTKSFIFLVFFANDSWYKIIKYKGIIKYTSKLY